MKKNVYILIIACLLLTSCTTTKVNSIADDQYKLSELRQTFLFNTIWNIDSNIYNNLKLIDILQSDVSKLTLVENEVPYLKSDLQTFDKDIHTALRLANFEYQKILINYSQDLDFPLIYPDGDGLYTITDTETTHLFDTYGKEIKQEITTILKDILKEPVKEYRNLATNYNIYCNSLIILKRQSLPIIDVDIEDRLINLFLTTFNNNLLIIEKSNKYENTAIDPNLLIITK